MPVYLRPSAPTARDALLCGDPGRALTLAQALLVKPLMSNHHRGLWGYHGQTSAGRALTVHATGIGGPSAAAVISEMAELGLQRAIRLGTCSAPGGSPPAGSVHVVGRALAGDGASAALGFPAGTWLEPDPGLTEELCRRSGSDRADLESVDVLSSSGSVGSEAVALIDLQTAATLATCSRLGITAAAVVAVASAGGRRLEDEPVEAELVRLASVAAESLAAQNA